MDKKWITIEAQAIRIGDFFLMFGVTYRVINLDKERDYTNLVEFDADPILRNERQPAYASIAIYKHASIIVNR